MTELEAKLLAALRATQAVEDHFGSCHDCGGDLRGNTWQCEKWCALKGEAIRLRQDALRAAAVKESLPANL